MSITQVLLIVVFLMGLGTFFTGLYRLVMNQEETLWARLVGLGGIVALAVTGVALMMGL